MMKHNIFLEIILTISLVFVSCQKDEVVPVTSLSVDAMEIKTSYTTADIVWNVESEATINEVVLEYSTDSTFISAKKVRMSKPDKEANKYVASLDSLENGTSYYIRCKAINKFNSTISKTDSLRTLAYQLAKVNTDSISSVTVSASKLHATLLEWGTDTIPQVGFCIASHSSVSIADSCILCPLSDIQDTISFAASIDNLIDNSTYYIRAFAKNNKGVSYGEELYFSTVEIVVPTVGETVVSNISYTTAQCRSNIIWEGGSSVTTCGFCYSTSDNPTTNDDKVLCSSKKFSSTLTGLSANTTYYIRAFATNCKGTAYGCATSFKTNAYSLPTVETSEISDITYTTATCGGNVTSDGDQDVTERGICYSISPNPTISDTKIVNGNGLGSFSCNLSGLKDATTYYVRAYATNSVGTSYGDNVEFATTAYTLPVVSISIVKNITCTKATCEGEVSADGGQVISERGVCYSTSPNPTIEDNKIQSSNGLGAFTCNIENLSESTKYYIRAYAINNVGVAYSTQIEFSTPESGMLSGVFSVSATRKVHFSKGNLQYQASTDTWSFASSQWFIYEKYSPSSISSTSPVWIALFGWGTSGYDNKYPYKKNYEGSSYGDGTNDISGTSYDWGQYNAIENGGNEKGLWRTLTYDEWNYLINTRCGDGLSLHGFGNINGDNGLILLPDNWIEPDGIQFISTRNKIESDYTVNSYTFPEWAIMESAGAVFLPAGGNRDGVSLSGYNEIGYYWSSSSTSTSNSSALYVTFFVNYNYSHVSCSNSASRSMGASVRLVQDVK